MNAKNRFFRTRVVLMAVSSLVILSASSSAIAQSGAPSDELLITAAGGAPVLFDNFLPELGPAAGEPGLAFTGGPGPGAQPIPLAVILGTPGVDIVALTEPAGQPPAPGEVPIVISGPNGPIILSDLIVSTLGGQATLPPFIELYSDGNPELQQITGLPPTAHFLEETGLLQNLNPFLFGIGGGGPFGPINVFVSSDVTVPEPSSLLLSAVGFVGFAAWRWRRKR